MVFGLASNMGYSVNHIMWEMSLPQILLLSEASKIVYNNDNNVQDINAMSEDEIEAFLKGQNT
jgi:hypothetical protein